MTEPAGKAQETLETIAQLLSEVVENPPVNYGPDSDLVEELGLSSIDVMELVGRVEDTYDIVFPLNDLASIRTLRELAAQVDQVRASA